MAWSAGPQAAWVAEANRGERPEFRPIPGAFNADALIEDALARSQTADEFADDDFVEPLSIFCDALEETARLTPLGRWATQRYLRRLLDVRLELEAHEAAHPELDNEEVVEPIFVIGPPRSGTTVLHRHLGAVGGHRVSRGWEFTRPLPPPDPKTRDHDPRIHQAAEELEFPQAVAAGLRSIHAYSAQMPKECLSAMSFAARTEEFISRYDVPAYVDWLQACDMAPAYAMHRRILRVLQQRMPPARWILKSPVHLQALPTLVAAYPDASFIVTHREPAEFLASVSSLVATLRSAFSDSVDPIAIGRYHQDLYQRSLNALVDHVDRRVLPPERTVHVSFKDLVADTPATVASICASLGIDAAATRHSTSTVAKEVREDAASAHKYQPADFGLDTADTQQSFSRYRTRFIG
ncbi:MAG: sulfotransferase [Acidimicrobiaceae bacterium]|nr:sulfotransferase [Acidimicrobiaceae bacterium]